MRVDVVAALTKAKAFVQRGWVQNRSTDGYTKVCSAQAIQNAVHELSLAQYDDELRDDIEVAGRILLAAAHEQTGTPWGNIPMWNDYLYRTKEEVLDTFDHAIKLAERDSLAPVATRAG